MTQAHAATLFRVAVTTVSAWECGRFGLDPKVPIICDSWDVMRPEQRKQLFERWGLKPAKKGRGARTDSPVLPRR